MNLTIHYAYGLRNKGFDLLNAVGCTCSIDHVRGHGSYWAGQRNPIQQLNATQFWRVTIDNLNFYLKFAKSLPESSTGVKNVEFINWTGVSSSLGLKN